MDRSAVRPHNDPLRAGIYRHHKHTDRDPRYYQMLGYGRHSETEEQGAVYIPLYPAGGPRIVFRPLDLFHAPVEKGGVIVPRFTFVGTEIPEFSV